MVMEKQKETMSSLSVVIPTSLKNFFLKLVEKEQKKDPIKIGDHKTRIMTRILNDYKNQNT